MKNRWFLLLTISTLTLVGLLFLGNGIGQAATVARSTGGEIDAVTEGAPGGEGIRATRITSIPYGINDTLMLSNGGHEVTVTGPTGCPDEGTTFNLQVRVEQASNGAFATGHTSGDCDDDTWSVDAVTPGPHALAPGAAEACGKVEVLAPGAGAIVFHWCKDVTLEL